jgi:uncharacterized protein DUF1924
MRKRSFVRIVLLSALACPAPGALAGADFGSLYRLYSQAGGRDFNPDRGKDFWLKERIGEGGEPMNCATCHGSDLRKQGRHNKSGKAIPPMAPSVNKDRYTDVEKVEKWFLRNCKQVMKRECTPQEKGDVLRYLSQS